MTTHYERVGASATKDDVHRATAGLDAGEYPTAFCRLGKDVLGGDPNWVSAAHADGAGTKALVAYLHFRETGDASVFRGIAHDALAMNLDDLLCVGAADRFLLANTIGRNARLVPGNVVGEIVAGFADSCRTLAPYGVEIVPTGGETADLGDAVRTLVVDSVLATRLPRAAVIDAANIAPGDAIVGLSSAGRAFYEAAPNSGVGSNGLTLARHLLLAPYYLEKYPETVAPETGRAYAYRGKFRLDDSPPGLGMTVGQALLSPTRTYAPIVRTLLRELPGEIHGMIHCTGGGLGKCLRFGRNIRYVKDRPLPCPPFFRLIADAGVPPAEMARTFNLGCRLEIMLPARHADFVVETALRFGVQAQVVGRCEPSPAGNRVTAATAFGDVELE